MTTSTVTLQSLKQELEGDDEFIHDLKAQRKFSHDLMVAEQAASEAEQILWDITEMIESCGYKHVYVKPTLEH